MASSSTSVYYQSTLYLIPIDSVFDQATAACMRLTSAPHGRSQLHRFQQHVAPQSLLKNGPYITDADGIYDDYCEHGVAAFSETLASDNAIVIRYQHQRPPVQSRGSSRDLEMQDRLQQLAEAAAGDEVSRQQHT
jgi:hypothetical protein